MPPARRLPWDVIRLCRFWPNPPFGHLGKRPRESASTRHSASRRRQYPTLSKRTPIRGGFELPARGLGKGGVELVRWSPKLPPSISSFVRLMCDGVSWRVVHTSVHTSETRVIEPTSRNAIGKGSGWEPARRNSSPGLVCTHSRRGKTEGADKPRRCSALAQVLVPCGH